MDCLYVVCGFVLSVIGVKFIEYLLRRPLIGNITKDKYVFITGCDTGFGNLLARQLDKRGVHVIASCLSDKGRRDLDDATSERVKVILLDVAKHSSVEAAYQEVLKILPHPAALWGVVNNAGIAISPGYSSWARLEDYEKVLRVNFFGTIDVTLTFLPLLRKSSGRLVNMASVGGRFAGLPGGYSESKFAVEAFSDMVRRERKFFGDRFKVSIIEPAFFSTPLASYDNYAKPTTAAWNRLSDEQKEYFPEKLLTDYISKTAALIRMTASHDISLVTNDIEHALFARWPKNRYNPGLSAKLIWIPMSYAPSWLSDFLAP